MYNTYEMNASFVQRHPYIKDFFGLLVFIVCVIIGTLFINLFIFRSFSVLGPSMESTLFTGDRLIVNRLPVTASQLQNKPYIPERGQVIVFKNPRYTPDSKDEYIVKRVIAFPDERVTVEDGTLKVYNGEYPNGFEPRNVLDFPDTVGSSTSGDVDVTVPDGSLFVAGDHREGSYSYDSRSGLGYIPYVDIVGPVSLRVWPVNAISTFPS